MTALSSVNSGPPKAPACWPVTTATVAGIAQPLCSGACGCRRTAPLLLGREDLGNRDGLRGMAVPARDGIAPRLGGRRVAGVERRDLLKIEGVVADERTDPRQLAHVNPDRG